MAGNLQRVVRVVDLAADFHRLVIQVGLVERLRVVESVVVDVRVQLRQLLVTVSCVDEVVQLIVAVRQQRVRRARLYHHHHHHHHRHQQQQQPTTANNRLH